MKKCDTCSSDTLFKRGFCRILHMLQDNYLGLNNRLHPRNLPLPLNIKRPQDIVKLLLFLHRQQSNFAVFLDARGYSDSGNGDNRTTARCVGVRADPCECQLRGRDGSTFQ